MSELRDLLVEVLRRPDKMLECSMSEWDALIPQARASLLLGYLYYLLQQRNLEQDIPERVLQHLYSGYIVSLRQNESVMLEKDQISKTLAKIAIPTILLKGAAYVALEFPFAVSRLLSDIDLLVTKPNLEKVENHLSEFGWIPTAKDDYDERYYREWMHEIPPIQHEARRTVLDIHHTILPPTTGARLNPEKLFDDAVSIEKNVLVLSPVDMVLHSATHLFHEGEFEHGLRDLVDMHELLQHFSAKAPDFWQKLLPRAIELDLFRSLYYCLHYTSNILHTPVPEHVLKSIREPAPNLVVRKTMDWLFLRAFRPSHHSCNSRGTRVARWMLFVRSHYLRMPIRLLIPHLVRKAWKRKFAEPETQNTA